MPTIHRLYASMATVKIWATYRLPRDRVDDDEVDLCVIHLDQIERALRLWANARSWLQSKCALAAFAFCERPVRPHKVHASGDRVMGRWLEALEPTLSSDFLHNPTDAWLLDRQIKACDDQVDDGFDNCTRPRLATTAIR